ncbi:hypothetical protein LUZ60_010592 [Juncus effusus]|nr:hypothetical protein LUZ60_010592 [Juncus effusus]
MEESSTHLQKIAVVTGANKGIGLEICKQLLERGVKVVLTARDKNRGQMAVKKLQQLGAENIEFHQLDIADSASIASLKEFIENQFGRLDILINNAGVTGVEMEAGVIIEEGDAEGVFNAYIDTYEKAKESIDINYYGTKKMCEAFIPLLQLSESPRIVNVSSGFGKLQFIPGESIKNEIRNINDLTTERLEELLASFLDDFKAGTHIDKGWPKAAMPAYKVSKVGVCAYTRILAKNYPSICTNCVHPGYVKTDMNFNTGNVTVEEGASGPVMLAFLPDGSPSGQFYDQTKLSSFE